MLTPRGGRGADASRRHGSPLQTRLVICVSAVLAAVCAAMTTATVLAQNRFVLESLDQCVDEVVERNRDALRIRSDSATHLGFLDDLPGQSAGALAARYDSSGRVLAAAVVSDQGTRRSLSAEQRAALNGITPDGSAHTRDIPGLGAYRLIALDDVTVPVLAGLPMDDATELIDRLVAVETLIAVAGLVTAAGACAVIVRRQLRPLSRVAATAADVARVPLHRGEVGGLSRVPALATGPDTEASQVGVALNRLIEHVESSITERQHTEERMRRFLSDASHELRTPLASIAGYAELMVSGTRRIEPALAWRRVAAQSLRMKGLVEDLLLLARLDEGRPLRKAGVNVATLVAEAVWDARAAGGDHLWQVLLRVSPSAEVVGDPVRLHQVLANVLANARMHTPPGTRITVTAEIAEAHCVIRVHDDGPGIPDALLPTVFERFTRVDTGRSRTAGRAGGSGLGLAIAAAIVRAHDGRMKVRSTPGDTEFTVLLPLTERLPADSDVRGPDSRTALKTPAQSEY
ncbi:sensor histidine kinase [Streptomyces sp. CRN 30]|uniref:sensor histidine kinase n=1 Tax=Streptomyces sp. CRN 30 TaxID=3075613 RepID=UPI002A841B90|nr:ATP-binding protein [Streptomyces sp. CRN 30]